MSAAPCCTGCIAKQQTARIAELEAERDAARTCSEMWKDRRDIAESALAKALEVVSEARKRLALYADPQSDWEKPTFDKIDAVLERTDAARD